MGIVTPILKSAPCVKKLGAPILTSADMPFESALVFNAGVAKFNGKYVMVFRNDYGTSEETFLRDRCFTGTSIGVAYSDNGIDGWHVRKTPLVDNHDLMAQTGREIHRYYDPRITIIDGRPYLCLAADTRHGIRGCIASVNDEFDRLDVISMSTPNNRNMVLFPEKIGGDYYRLERPMAMYSDDAFCFDIWCSRSPDLKLWGDPQIVADIRDVPYADHKIGPAAPPIKTDKGWLTTFHAVDYDSARGKNGWDNKWQLRYTTGIMLLDLDDPSKIVGMCKTPLLAPELGFETDEGFRQNVIFPGGMILEPGGEVKLYYGASDTVECLATADINDLIALCLD